MSKKSRRSGLYLLLVMLLLAGLTGCGKKSNNENAALAKENVYAYENIEVGDFGDNASIRHLSFDGERVYAYYDIYIYAEQESAASGAKVAASYPVVMPEVDGDMMVDPEYEYVPPQHINRIVSFLPDGSDVQQVDLQMTEEELNNNNSWIGFVAIKDGKIYVTREGYYEDYSDPEKPISESREELLCFGKDGNKLWSLPLTDLIRNEEAGEYYYISNLLVDTDGSVYLICNGDATKILAVDPNGAFQKEIPTGLGQDGYLHSASLTGEGSVLMLNTDANWTKMYASTLDLKTGTSGEKTELPGNITMYNVYPGVGEELLLVSNQGVFSFTIGDTEIKPKMNYVNSDLNISWMNQVAAIDETHFIGIYADAESYEQQIAVFTAVPPEEIPDKEVLVLGSYYLNSDVRTQVIKFNKASEKYRITVKDYSVYNTMDDYMAGYTQLNNDILAGRMPDIILANESIPVDNYIAKGLLADVGKLIEADEELSKESFLTNVFDAYSVNDVLYRVVPSFTVSTVVAKESLLGDYEGWNMEEFMAFVEKLPEETQVFGEITRSSFFYQIMRYCGTDFVDLATGKCAFDSDEFIRMLEFAKTVPEEITYGEDYDWTLYESQYRDDRTILMTANMYSIRDLNYQFYGQFGEEVTFIGFPCEDKNGSVVTANMSFVLSKDSSCPEGAWEFVRYYLTDEYQDTIQWEMPVNRDAFLKLANQATERPYYMNGDEKVEYDETIYINGEEIILPPMSQEQVDRIVSFIESVDKVSYYNEQIQNIIDEDAAPFFDGQKTAADAASVIQNRAQVYVNANR